VFLDVVENVNALVSNKVLSPLTIVFDVLFWSLWSRAPSCAATWREKFK
jgi:hypothetical protein